MAHGNLNIFEIVDAFGRDRPEMYVRGGMSDELRYRLSLSTREALDRDLEAVPQPGDPAHAHIVKTEPGEDAIVVVFEARINGTPVTALCGFVWVPSRDPRSLPVCPECKSIYDAYAATFGLMPEPRE